MRRLLSLLAALVMLTGCTSCFAEDNGFDMTGFVTRLMQGEDISDVYARFSPEMQAAVPQESLAALWSQLTAACGEFESFAGEPTITAQDGATVLVQLISMERMGLNCTVVLAEDGTITGLSFTPAAKPEAEEPAPAEGTLEEDVTIGQEPWQLPGTLTLPEQAETPVPAVVLVHGSGPNDRDESVGAVKLFRDLAGMLSSQGIAVLRYDKRTYVYGAEIAGSEDYAAFTAEEETIQDAIAAGQLLAADSRIDPEQIYVLGHSLGAMLAPRIVSESDGLFCGMILACGTNSSLIDIMIRQNEDAIAALPEEQRADYESMLSEAKEQIAALTDMTAAQAQATAILGQPGYYFWEMAQWPTAAELIESLAMPTLLINGERDFQVNVQEGREGWEQALDLEAPYITCLWADVNHMLMRPDVDEAIAGTTAEYAAACTLDEDVANTIAAFILK